MLSLCSTADRCTLAALGCVSRQLRQFEIVRGEQREAAVVSIRCRAIAHASARPSKVEVPRPTSSISTSECSVAPFRIAADSVISTMKVERPPARSSAAPMRVKMRSIGPITALVGRHEAADVGQQRDQRHLAHEGRFTAHVGAGDQQQLALVVEARSRWR